MTTRQCDAKSPVEEQRAMVEHIARETERGEAVLDVAKHTNPFLKECCSALIVAAVNGEIDVGRWRDQRAGHTGASALGFRAVVGDGAEFRT